MKELVKGRWNRIMMEKRGDPRSRTRGGERAKARSLLELSVIVNLLRIEKRNGDVVPSVPLSKD